MELTDEKMNELANLLCEFKRNERAADADDDKPSARFYDGCGYGIRIALRALYGDRRANEVIAASWEEAPIAQS